MRARKAGGAGAPLLDDPVHSAGRPVAKIVLIVALVALIGLGVALILNPQVSQLFSALWQSMTGAAIGAPAAAPTATAKAFVATPKTAPAADPKAAATPKAADEKAADPKAAATPAAAPKAADPKAAAAKAAQPKVAAPAAKVAAKAAAKAPAVAKDGVQLVPAGGQQLGKAPKVALAPAKSRATRALNPIDAPILNAGDNRVIVKVPKSNEANAPMMDIVDEPIPEDCFAEQHADYDGYAVQWGLGHKAKSAAECCRLCKAFKPKERGAPDRCNIWVWCGDPSGKCWTMDIHSHRTGDCWLKYQAGWDNSTDRATTNLVVNHRARFSPEFRKEHKTAPEWVPWIAGLARPSK